MVDDYEASPASAALNRRTSSRAGSTDDNQRLNAEISARIANRLKKVDVGRELAEEGITTVCVEDGVIVEHDPGGETRRL